MNKTVCRLAGGFLLLLLGSGGWGKTPEFQLDPARAVLGKGVLRDRDVITIVGNRNEIRSARFSFPLAKIGGAKKIFLSVQVLARDLVLGDRAFQTAKLKAYFEGPQKKRAGACWIPAGLPSRWLEAGMVLPLEQSEAQGNLIVELSMENCTGTAQFKHLQVNLNPPLPSREFPFTVPRYPVCSLTIDTTAAVPFNNLLLGLNSHFMGGNRQLSYSHPEIRRQIGRIGVPLLRFPGGTVANWYDFETDMWKLTPSTATSVTMLKRLREGIAEQRKFQFDQYLFLAQREGFPSTVVLNVLHDSPQQCADNVMMLKRHKLTFPWVELGNENYDKTQQSREITDVVSYIAKCRAITAAVKKVSPDTAVAVNIDEATAQEWARPLAREHFYDAVVMHPYCQADVNSGCFSEIGIAAALSSYCFVNRQIDNYGRVFGRRPLLLTEWGVSGNQKTVKTHLATLGTAGMFLGVVEGWEHGLVKNACLHIFSDSYMGLYDSNGKDRLYKRGYGVLYDLLVKAFKNRTIYAACSRSPEITPGQPAVMARATRGKDGRIMIYAVNLLPVKASLATSIDGRKFTGGYRLEFYTEKHLDDQTVYGVDENPVRSYDGRGVVTLPPYSISLVTLN